MNSQSRRKSGELIVSEEVIAKIAGVAARDVAGVADLVSRPSDIRSIINSDRASKAVRVQFVQGAMEITIYLALKAGVRIPDVCEQVQKGVKSAIQSMTGRPVSKVNVVVDDIVLDSDEAAEK